MRAPLARLVVLALVALGAACGAPRRGGQRRPRTNQTIITERQIRAGRYHNAYEAVAGMRAHWLRARGPDSFSTPSEVIVYLNNGRLGGVDMLRAINADIVAYIQHYDGIAAGARWGIGHGQGVIFVSTMEPPAAPDDTVADSVPR